MAIKQLSVFVENKKGRLSAILQQLAQNSIDITALSLADASEFGVLRMLVDQPEAAKKVLNTSGVTVRLSSVLAVVMNNEPGGAARILEILAAHDLDIAYMYVCAGEHDGKVMMIARVSDIPKAEEILAAEGYTLG